ncbi:MAG: type II toxin-antitoxin system RelE/ParE family toxin [Pseudaminobacter sp.]|nr:type II toxin-antitoxin system RelE/ParE family toxin [Pseudaminobacter sp.]
MSERATRDLLDIYIFGLERFGFAQTDRYRLGLDKCFSMLADNPRIGGCRTRSGPVCAGMSMASMSCYKEHPDHVLIVAVVHGRSVKGLKL